MPAETTRTKIKENVIKSAASRLNSQSARLFVQKTSTKFYRPCVGVSCLCNKEHSDRNRIDKFLPQDNWNTCTQRLSHIPLKQLHEHFCSPHLISAEQTGNLLRQIYVSRVIQNQIKIMTSSVTHPKAMLTPCVITSQVNMQVAGAKIWFGRWIYESNGKTRGVTRGNDVTWYCSWFASVGDWCRNFLLLIQAETPPWPGESDRQRSVYTES